MTVLSTVVMVTRWSGNIEARMEVQREKLLALEDRIDRTERRTEAQFERIDDKLDAILAAMADR